MRTPWQRRRRRCQGAGERWSAVRLLGANVARVPTKLATVLTLVLQVALQVAAVLPEIARVALQLVPSGDDTGRVARRSRARDRLVVVPDLPAIAGDLALALPNLVPIGFQLTAVVAYFGAWMRSLSGERTGGRHDDGGAEQERRERGHLCVSR